MSVIERHVRRLPTLDERWSVRPHDRDDLEAALLAGGVAGTATHPLDNVRANALMLIDGDPDKLFGLTGLQGSFDLDGILELVAREAGAPIDPEARYGPVEIAPGPILDACQEAGDRLATAAAGAERVVIATGHPVGLALLYHAVDDLLTCQGAEVLRLAALVPAAERGGASDEQWLDALAELLAAFPVYRAYLPAGTEELDAAVALASRRRPELAAAFEAIAARLVAEPEAEFTRRFMQTTGPVMAKGVEDTTFYRFTRLGTLTEVGGDPTEWAVDAEGFHAASAHRQAAWPAAMTSLSTHDTKRSEDVRARLSVLAEMPERWAEVLGALREVSSTGDGPFDNLLWQAIVGAWPASRERLHAYAEKASREAGNSTTWSEPDEAFEEKMHHLVDAAFGDARAIVEGFVDEIAPLGRSNSLSLKLLQLAGPGVPDVYQGTELWDHSLVDPDNRREVDFAERRRLLARLDEGWMPPVDGSGAAKLLVVSRALRLKRDHPELFTRYTPMTAAGDAAEHAVAFDRGGVVAVATRLPAGLAARGGWGDTELLTRTGVMVDVLTGRRVEGGRVRLADLLDTYPVALLAPADVIEGDAS